MNYKNNESSYYWDYVFVLSFSLMGIVLFNAILMAQYFFFTYNYEEHYFSNKAQAVNLLLND